MKTPCAVLAGHVLTPSGAFLRNAGVVWVGERILDVGPRDRILKRDPRILADDADTILIPGLVNAHAHLELTELHGAIPPGRPFTEWLRKIIRLKKRICGAGVRRSIRAGESTLLRNGVTAVADNCAFPESLRSARRLRTLRFTEIIGLHSPAKLPGSSAPICPHAPYSLSDDNLRKIAGWWNRHPRAPLSMHVAESPDESEYFLKGNGRFKQFYSNLNVSPRSFPRSRPIAHLDRLRLLRHGLTAVHANDVTAEEARLLHERDVAVAVCPGSLEYFQFSRAGVRRLVRAGVEICFGTDSMASNTDLNLFAELRRARRLWGLSSRRLIDSATRLPGNRLWGGRTGNLVSGAWADFILVRKISSDGNPFDDLLAGRAERRILLRVLAGRAVTL